MALRALTFLFLPHELKLDHCHIGHLGDKCSPSRSLLMQTEPDFWGRVQVTIIPRKGS